MRCIPAISLSLAYLSILTCFYSNEGFAVSTDLRSAPQVVLGLESPSQIAQLSTCSCCPADFNGNGSVTIDDLFLFFNAYFSGQVCADADRSGSVSVDDIFIFLNLWFIGDTQECNEACGTPLICPR